MKYDKVVTCYPAEHVALRGRAWIEIKFVTTDACKKLSPSAGGRGLKSAGLNPEKLPLTVALRGRAWIEIERPQQTGLLPSVALRGRAWIEIPLRL